MMAETLENNGRSFTLSYPRVVRLARLALAGLLLIAALVVWAQAWVQFVGPLFEGARLADRPLRPLLAANVGLPLAIWGATLVFAFLPDLALTADGLAVRTLWGWRSVPWRVVTAVRTVTFTRSARRLVIVHGRWGWGGAWSTLVSICVGAGIEPALLFTSAIRDFEPLVGRLRSEAARANPNLLLDDEFFSLPARLAAEPVPTLAGLTDQSREDGWPLAISAQAMAGVSAGLLLVLLLVLAFRGGVWWEPLVIVLAGAAEWLAGATYLYALSAVFPGELEMRQAALLYPIAQIPRALLTVPMLALVAAGLPFLASMVGLAAILWAVVLTALLVQQAYRLPSVLPALAGAAIQALFQFMLLALIFT